MASYYDEYNGQVQQQSQEAPNRDTATPDYESEEEKKKRLAAAGTTDAQPAAGTPTIYDGAGAVGSGNVYKPQVEPEKASGAAIPPIPGNSPMVSPTGGVPEGTPYSPTGFLPTTPAGPVTANDAQQAAPQQATPPQQGQFSNNNQGLLDWATQKYGPSASRGGGFVDAQAGGGLENILKAYAAATGNTANFQGGPSGDRVDFGQGPQDALTSGGQIWNAAGGGGAPAQGAPSYYNPSAPTGPVGRPFPTSGPTTTTSGGLQPPPQLPPEGQPLTAPPGPNAPTAPPNPNQSTLDDLIKRLMTQQGPEYKAAQIGQYQAPDLSQQNSNLNNLLNKVANTPAPQYNAANISQYNAPDLSKQTGDINNLVGQLMNTNLPQYQAANISQFNAKDNPAISGLQDANLMQTLSSPTYNEDYKNKLNEAQKEMLVNRGRANKEDIAQNAARRGVTDSGRTEATQQRANTDLTNQLMQSQRDVELQTTGANRQGMLDALNASQGILGSRAGIDVANYGAKLSGETAQAGENKSAYQSLMDAFNAKSNLVGTASNAATAQGNLASQAYTTGLAGQTVQANEKGKEYQSLVDAVNQRNTAAGVVGQGMATQSGIAGQNFQNQLAGQTAQAGENKSNYQSLIDQINQKNTAAGIGLTAQGQNNQVDQFGKSLAENARQFDKGQGQQESQFTRSQAQQQGQFNTTSGLARDQFNESTRQFDKNFIEQVRQFDAGLANDMAKFNASNQQGYDLANLNSENRRLDRISGGA